MLNSLSDVLVLLLSVILSGLIGKWIGGLKGNGRIGFWLGFLLGPLGWIIAVIVPKDGPKCPACGGVTNPGARKCCHCGEVLIKAASPWNRR